MMCKGLKSNPSVTEREGGVWRATQKISVYWRIRQRALSLKGPPRVRSDDNDVLPFRLGARRATRCPIV
jgi:hypothetical protein